jgi:hypothetical protein
MLCLWFRRFKRASEDGDAGVVNDARHLWVGHVLVDDDAFDEGGVFEGAADFGVYFDEFKVDVSAVEVCDCEDCVDGDLGEFVVGFGHAEYLARRTTGGGYILLPREVLAALKRFVVSSLENSKVSAMVSRVCTANLQA